MIQILTDSCSDLSPELIKRYNIHIVPLWVTIKEKTYRDGVDITSPQQLFLMANATGQLPKTSAPSVGEMVTFFNGIPGDLIFISIGSKLSATNQNAIIAAQNLPDRKIRVIDSANLSTGIGLLVIKAAELRDLGKSMDEIEKEILATVPRVRTSFVIDTLDYLYKGGRCSALENIVGSLLKIRPVIEVRQDGTLGVKDKTRGARSKALASMLEACAKDLPGIDLHRIFVTHSGCDADAEAIASELAKMANIDDICITTAGATISSHCGPNTIGILYIMKA